MRGLTLAALFLLVFSASRVFADNCSVSATSIQFYTYVGAVIDVTGTLNVSCNKPGVDYTIGLSAGSGGNVTTRAMLLNGAGPNRLGYGLFRNTLRTLNWGTTDGVDTVAGVTDANGQDVQTIYGRIPINEIAPAGSYIDTISVTLNYHGKPAVTTFTVNATIGTTCTISATDLSFGNYTGVQNNATSTISVTCTLNAAYNIGLDAGLATGATVSNRSMSAGTALLSYQLFRDSGRTANWGNTIGVDTFSGTGSGLAQTLTVYGRIPAGQPASPGIYSDTIVVTMTY